MVPVFMAISPTHPLAIRLAKSDSDLRAFFRRMQTAWALPKPPLKTAEKKRDTTPSLKSSIPLIRIGICQFYVANFVLMDYGHRCPIRLWPHTTQRDLDFRPQIRPASDFRWYCPKTPIQKNFAITDEAYTGDGTIYQSDFFEWLRRRKCHHRRHRQIRRTWHG